MKKQIVKESRPFWISYILLLALTVLGFLIPKDNDLIWPHFFFFYLPFLLCGIYLYGLLMGIWMQRKYKFSSKKIILLSVIFLFLAILLLIPTRLDGMLKNGVLYGIDFVILPAIGATLCFSVTAFITRALQQRKLKSIDVTQSKDQEGGA